LVKNVQRPLTYRTDVIDRRGRARPAPSNVPSTVRNAGVLAAIEGAAGLIVAAVLLIRGIGGANQGIVNGFGTAGWFAIMGGAVAAAGWALVTGRRWGRGVAVFANLLLLPVAWYVIRSHQPIYAVGVGLVAMGVLVLLFTPAAVRWASGAGDSG
jgi:hypothetical protein